MRGRFGQTLGCIVVMVGMVASFGCQGGGGGVPDDPARGISFALLPDTTLDGGSVGAVECTVSPAVSGGGLVVELNATGAANLKALYGQLRYDPAQWAPGELTPSAIWGDANGVLSLAVEHDPGVLDVGCVLIHWDQRAGISGEGQVARVELRPALAGRAKIARQSLEPQVFTSMPEIERPAGKLTWMCCLTGDYDGNNEVNVSDMTPLGRYLGQTLGGVYSAPSGIHVDKAFILPDGNRDNEINTSDITEIGRYFGMSLEGYRVYHSTDWWVDYPRPDYSAPALSACASVGKDHLFDGASGKRPYYQLDVVESDPLGDYWWVVPYLGSWTGKSSASAMETGLSPARQDLTYQLAYDTSESKLTWYYNVRGDFNDDTFFNISDVTPIGVFRDRIVSPDYHATSGQYIPWLSDGCRDGVINLEEIAVVYQLLNTPRISGYDIFETNDPLEVPTDPYASPTLIRAAAIVFNDTDYTPLELHEDGRLSVSVAVPSGSYIWIQPYSSWYGPVTYGAMSEVIQVP